MGFGLMLKTLREKAGLTQEKLAKQAGLSLRSIQNWEQGHRTPRAQIVLALARAIGVPVEKLLTEITLDRPTPRQNKRTRGPRK